MAPYRRDKVDRGTSSQDVKGREGALRGGPVRVINAFFCAARLWLETGWNVTGDAMEGKKRGRLTGRSAPRHGNMPTQASISHRRAFDSREGRSGYWGEVARNVQDGKGKPKGDERVDAWTRRSSRPEHRRTPEMYRHLAAFIFARDTHRP